MDFSTMKNKIDHGEYNSIADYRVLAHKHVFQNCWHWHSENQTLTDTDELDHTQPCFLSERFESNVQKLYGLQSARNDILQRGRTNYGTGSKTAQQSEFQNISTCHFVGSMESDDCLVSVSVNDSDSIFLHAQEKLIQMRRNLPWMAGITDEELGLDQDEVIEVERVDDTGSQGGSTPVRIDTPKPKSTM